MDDGRLVKQSIKGNHKAFKEIVLQYGPQLLTVCRRYSSCSESANDVLQDAFIKVYQSLKRYDEGKGSLLSYMTKICINTALNKNKREKRYSEILVDQSLSSADHTLEPLEQLAAEEIIQLITQLPRAHADVFNLFVIEGYSHREIAELLGITASSSRVYLARAKEKLKTLVLHQRKREVRNGTY